jgi:hypothetical protein
VLYRNWHSIGLLKHFVQPPEMKALQPLQHVLSPLSLFVFEALGVGALVDQAHLKALVP